MRFEEENIDPEILKRLLEEDEDERRKRYRVPPDYITPEDVLETGEAEESGEEETTENELEQAILSPYDDVRPFLEEQSLGDLVADHAAKVRDAETTSQQQEYLEQSGGDASPYHHGGAGGGDYSSHSEEQKTLREVEEEKVRVDPRNLDANI